MSLMHIHRSIFRNFRGTIPLAAAILSLGLLAGCGKDSPTAAEVTPRPDDVTQTIDQLAQTVASQLVPADFVEPEDLGLIMQVRGTLLFVKGVVFTGSDEQMITLLNNSPGVTTVVLTSIPGSANDEVNLALGRKLRNAGITMYLPAQGMVASGGTDLLISGTRRIIERGAQVGVHSWAAGSVNGNEVPRNDPQHQLFLDYYRDMGIPEDFYWFTLEAAPPEGMHWMTEGELTRYQVSTVLR